MKKLTGLGKTLIATDPDKIRLDLAVKNILAFKPLLARIFKEVVSECRDIGLEEIEASIEGDIVFDVKLGYKQCYKYAIYVQQLQSTDIS